nr:MAG TPA: hypothetical protein [Caudoviricetes sp.]
MPLYPVYLSSLLLPCRPPVTKNTKTGCRLRFPCIPKSGLNTAFLSIFIVKLQNYNNFCPYT